MARGGSFFNYQAYITKDMNTKNMNIKEYLYIYDKNDDNMTFINETLDLIQDNFINNNIHTIAHFEPIEIENEKTFLDFVDKVSTNNQSKHENSPENGIYIHINLHGNRNHIFWGEDAMTWEKFYQSTSKICKAYNGNLVLKLTSCKSEQSLQEIYRSAFSPEHHPYQIIIGVISVATAGSLISDMKKFYANIFKEPNPNPDFITAFEEELYKDTEHKGGTIEVIEDRTERIDEGYYAFTIHEMIQMMSIENAKCSIDNFKYRYPQETSTYENILKESPHLKTTNINDQATGLITQDHYQHILTTTAINEMENIYNKIFPYKCNIAQENLDNITREIRKLVIEKTRKNEQHGDSNVKQ